MLCVRSIAKPNYEPLMPDDPRELPLRRPSLKPGPSERAITLSHEHFLSLLDAFEDCAQSLQHKLILLDDLYGLLQPCEEGGSRRVLTSGKQRAVQQILVDLRAIRAEAEEQAD